MIVILTLFDVVVVEETHVAFDVKIHVTICPFVSVEELYVAVFVPTFAPFTCHW